MLRKRELKAENVRLKRLLGENEAILMQSTVKLENLSFQPVNQEPFISRPVRSPKFQRAFSDRRTADWTERNMCPENDILCAEAVLLSQNVLLAERVAIEQIVNAIQKMQRHADALAHA